jgi:hypothetical protein
MVKYGLVMCRKGSASGHEAIQIPQRGVSELLALQRVLAAPLTEERQQQYRVLPQQNTPFFSELEND